MSIFKSSNPTLSKKTFGSHVGAHEIGQEQMTVQGTLTKFGITLLMLISSAAFTWKAFFEGKEISGWVMGSAIGGLVVALIIAFRPKTAPYLTPVYALIKGVMVGGISAIFSNAFEAIAPNIVMQAVGLTFGVVLAMFGLYTTGILKATPMFKKVVIIATAGIAVFYLLSFVLGFFGIAMPLIHSSGTWGIVFSLVVVGIAALNLIMDFDLIEQGSAQGAPKYMEWYGSFALMVTIIWLYIEILRLLSKIYSRD